MTVVLQTSRLMLRKFTTDDAAFILRLVNEPSWLQYIGDRHVRSIEDAEQYLLKGALTSYEVNGFGPWLVVLKETGVPAGMCGIFKREYLDIPDIGFAFVPEYTGKGYAFEMTSAILGYAREQLGIDRFAAFTAQDNEASIGLLAKLGFTKEGFLTLEGQELFLFKTS